MAHAGGQPTKYDSKYCDDIIRYFTEQRAVGKYPQFNEYADHIGVVKQTLLNWCDEHKEFLDSYARAKEIAEADLVAGGLTNKYNSQFAQFIAKNNFGYKDKVEIDQTNKVTIIDDYGID